MDIEIDPLGQPPGWKGRVREELVGYLTSVGLDKERVLAGLRTQFDELLLHGRYACEHDEVAKSIRSFRECARLQPTAFLPQLALGRIYMGQGYYHAAETHIRKAASVNPRNFAVLITWLFLLRRTGVDPAQAARLQNDIDAGAAALAKQLGYDQPLDVSYFQLDHPQCFYTTIDTHKAAEEFRNNRYTVLHDVLPAPILPLVLMQQRAVLQNGKMSYQSHLGRFVAFDLPFPTIAAYQLSHLVGKLVGKDVIPSYTFAIHYLPSGQMEPHTDRPQNELSISLNLAVTPPADFPALRAGLHIDELNEISLRVNSGLLYRGTEVIHARCPVPKEHHVDQLVLGFRTVNPKHCSCFS
jgi:tetratricopeptide (TPR) repeat protein